MVVDCIEKFETSTRLTLHVESPLIYRVISSLDNITKGNEVWPDENQALALPSIYSRELTRAIRDRLQQMAWKHPLLLFGCYLNPLFRVMEFINDPIMHVEYRSKSEDFARKLTLKHKERTVIFNMEDEPITINDSDGENTSDDCCFRISSVLNQQQKVESLLGVCNYFFSIPVFMLLNKNSAKALGEYNRLRTARLWSPARVLS